MWEGFKRRSNPNQNLVRRSTEKECERRREGERQKKKDTNRGIKGKREAYAVKRAHYGRPAATVVWGTVNNCLHLGQCPGGVESEASDGHTHSQTLKHISKKIPFAKHVFLHRLISDTHTQTCSAPLIHTFLHIGRIRNTFSWVCEAAPHTKKHLGTGLVGLQGIHICPVQAIGIQSFTLSNATKREQSRPALFFALAAPLWEGLFCWANNEAVNTHFYCSTRGISLVKDEARSRVWGRLYYRGFEVLGGWECRRMDGWRHG